MRIVGAVYLASFLVAVLFLTGCGDAKVEVKGIIKYDGKPVETGKIRFEPVDGKTQPDGADINAGGEYTARVHVGAMKVTISYPRAAGKKALYPGQPNTPYQDVTEEVLPEKYSNPLKTELRYEVQPGANTKNWDLAK